MIEVYNLSYLDLLHSRHPNECGLTLKEWNCVNWQQRDFWTTLYEWNFYLDFWIFSHNMYMRFLGKAQIFFINCDYIIKILLYEIWNVIFFPLDSPGRKKRLLYKK
jgi:hypothetical protein